MPEFHAEAPQATVSEGLAQGPYVAARTGLFGRKASTQPMLHRRPTHIIGLHVHVPYKLKYMMQVI